MRVTRAAAAVLAAAALAVLPAAPALAHAELVETRPADGVLSAAPPDEVVLRFTEAVSVALGGVTVTAPSGARLDTPRAATRAGRREVAVRLPASLAEGTYLVTWRVVSADSHPVAGAFTFSVGRETPVARPPSPGTGGAAARVMTAARLSSFAGTVLLLGGALFLTVLWRRGRTLPAPRRVLWCGWATATAGSAIALLAHGPYAAGAPLRDAPRLLGDVVATDHGAAMVLRLVLLLAAAPLLATATRRERLPLPAAAASVVVAAGVLLATSATGHAGAGELASIAVPLDVLHLVAVSAWTGGVVLLATALLRRGEPAELGAVLPRWSRYATVAVAVLVVTGLFASWREVREPAALATPYGRVLLLKVGLVAGMVLLGATGRRLVRRSAAPGTLRRVVLFETGTGAVVIALTASLAGTTPARNDYAPVFRRTEAVHDGLRVRVEIAPARAGVNRLRLDYTTPAGDPADVADTSVRFLPHHSDDVLPVRPERAATGRYESSRVVLPHVGEWSFDVVTRTSDVDAYVTSFTVRIR